VVNSREEAVLAVQRAGELDRRRIRRQFEKRFTGERMARDYVRIYNAYSRRKRYPRKIA
jgi:hypothetical protein